MPQYLLSIYQPDGAPPDAETLPRITADLHRLNEELRESGSATWHFLARALPARPGDQVLPAVPPGSLQAHGTWRPAEIRSGDSTH